MNERDARGIIAELALQLEENQSAGGKPVMWKRGRDNVKFTLFVDPSGCEHIVAKNMKPSQAWRFTGIPFQRNESNSYSLDLSTWQTQLYEAQQIENGNKKS